MKYSLQSLMLLLEQVDWFEILLILWRGLRIFIISREQDRFITLQWGVRSLFLILGFLAKQAILLTCAFLFSQSDFRESFLVTFFQFTSAISKGWLLFSAFSPILKLKQDSGRWSFVAEFDISESLIVGLCKLISSNLSSFSLRIISLSEYFLYI